MIAVIGGSLAAFLGNDVKVKANSEMIYYLTLSYDGVDINGLQSNDSTVSELKSGNLYVEDKLPEGLIFDRFLDTSDGTIGAVKRSDGSVCVGKVVDDTNDNGGSSNGGGTPINGNSHGGDYSPYGGYSGSSSETSSTSSSTEVPLEETDVIKEGNSYTLPTSSKPATPSTPTTSKGNSAIPVLAGLAAAAAAGIGAKAYIDRKKNSNNDDDNQEEFKAEDWSDNNEINIEYQEPKTNEAETLDDDYEFEEPEKYGARSNQELENLQ